MTLKNFAETKTDESPESQKGTMTIVINVEKSRNNFIDLYDRNKVYESLHILIDGEIVVNKYLFGQKKAEINKNILLTEGIHRVSAEWIQG